MLKEANILNKEHLSLVLETPRLLLRRWLSRDVAPFAALNADPEVMEYFPATITLEETQLVIDIFEANFAMHGFSFWAVEMKGSGDFVGNVGLEPYDLAGNDGEAPHPPCGDWLAAGTGLLGAGAGA